MQQLKHIALFLFGAFLVIFGFRVNTDKTASQPAGQEKNISTEGGLPAEPEAREKDKPSDAGKTLLEEKTPEKASGSK